MSKNIFLFSIDLEDVRDGVVNGSTYKERVIPNTIKYLEWLSKNNFKCTFFTVGTIASRYPDLIKEITKGGHEIACHSFDHIPLDQHTQDSFKHDVEKNINALLKAGVSSVKGYRAPVFSLTKKTPWVHSILADCGITYSSSVLPANNPLYGWKEFGEQPKMIHNKILEIPLTTCALGPLKVPLAGGIYFRVLPKFIIMKKIKQHLKKSNFITSYFHPYDIDDEQEQFMHGGINNNKFYNKLMYYNRTDLFPRLNELIELDLNIITYEEYLRTYLKQ